MSTWVEEYDRAERYSRALYRIYAVIELKIYTKREYDDIIRDIIPQSVIDEQEMK